MNEGKTPVDNGRNFFILGAMKCGTTSLYSSLRQHPEICMSAEKEPVFFELDREYEKGKEYYLRRYFAHHDGEPLLGEARPRNLFLPWVPERIHNYFPDAKYIAILRDPVKRAYSLYWASRRSGIAGTETRTFERAIFENLRRLKQGRTYDRPEMKAYYQREYEPRGDGKFTTYLEGGYYYRQLKRYEELSSRDRIKVVLLEDFVENSLSICNEIFSFLGLSGLNNLEEQHRMNSYRPRSVILQRLFVGMRKLASRWNLYDYVPERLIEFAQTLNVSSRSFPDIKPLTKLWLYDHYEPENKKLETFLNRSLEEWSFDIGGDPG